MEELAALEGQRVALMLADTGGSVAGVLYAVDPWTKAVLLVQEPDAQQHQQHQQLQQGEGDGQLQNSGAIRKSSKSQLPTCIYVEGGQIKSWVVDPKSSNVAEGAAGSSSSSSSSSSSGGKHARAVVDSEWYAQCERALGAAAGTGGQSAGGSAGGSERNTAEDADPKSATSLCYSSSSSSSSFRLSFSSPPLLPLHLNTK